jgi:hypothetical protein
MTMPQQEPTVAAFAIECRTCSGQTWTALTLDNAIAWLRGHDQAHQLGIV